MSRAIERTVASVFVLACTLPLAALLNIWQDEAYTLHTTSHGLAYAASQAMSFEQSAPLYFVLLTVWRGIDGSVWFLRVFSILCAVVTAALIPDLARRYVSRADARLVTAAVVCNPFFIWAAIEMRPYAMIVMLSALLLLTFHDAFLSNVTRGRPVRYALYGLCVALALYTQYYLVFLVAAQAAILVIVRSRRFGAYVATVIGAAVLFAPMLVVVPGQVTNFRGGFVAPSFATSVATLAGIFGGYVFPLAFAHAKVVYVSLGVGATALAVAGRRHLRPRGDALAPVLLVIALLLFAVVTYVAGVHVLNRHAASLYVPSMLAVFAMFTYVRPSLGAWTVRLWTTIVVALSLFTMTGEYAHLAKPGDWRRVSAFIEEHERPHEPIVVFQAENALPLAYYYHGENTITAIPHAVDFRSYDVRRFVIHDARELRLTFPHGKRLWLVDAGACAADNIAFGCSILDRFVAQRYRVMSHATFFGSDVRLLERRPN